MKLSNLQSLSISLQRRGKRLTTVESCTGGGVAALITSLAGSSTWFDCAFITYSNKSKVKMVGVSESTLREFGAVSEPVALEMACGGLKQSDANCAIAITGIAGPGGGSESKPVGTVCFAWTGFSICNKTEQQLFQGDRTSVREQSIQRAVNVALELLLQSDEI